MADFQPITEFVFNNRSILSLNVLRLTWPQDWGLDYHDMEVKFSFDGIQSNGRGQFSNEETAFEIAASEAFERYIVKALGIRHSYGVACHSKKENALANSIRELIEREIFFRFFYDTKSFNQVDINSSQIFNISDNESCKMLLNQLTNLNLNIEFWEIGKTQLGPVIMCIAQGTNNASIISGGASFGLALCENQGASMLKSLIEVSCKIAFIKQYKLTNVSETDFLENQNKSSDLRQRLLLDRNYFESFKNSLAKGESNFDHISSVSTTEDIKSVLLSTDTICIINKAPIYIYQSFFQSESAYLGTGNVLKIAEQNKSHFLG
jgi:hypothetical protein